MKGLFCSECKARTNEEFRQVLKKRARNLWILFGIGICTAAAGFIAGYFWVEILPHQIGMVAGIGTGMVLGCTIALLRINGYLRDEEKIKKERLRETDERELEISSKALKATAKLLLAALYIVMIVGSMFYAPCVVVCSLLIVTFLIGYMVFRHHYEKVL